MAIKFRQYSKDGFNGDYIKVWNLLREIDDQIDNCYSISLVRWEWCRSHCIFDRNNENLTGLWEEDGKIVAMVCYETVLGDAFFNVLKGYEFLLEEMWDYAAINFIKDGKIKMAIPDEGIELKLIAKKKGYVATNDTEVDAILDIKSTNLEYTLPEGFSIISQDIEYDLIKYANILWNGFDHGKEGPLNLGSKELDEYDLMLSGPHNNLSLKIAVKNNEGNYVSYAGLWFVEGEDFCTIEPCATHPDYRRRGFGKAAIYEGIKRCAKLGAKYCIVGSNQDFYYRIGFTPYRHRTYYKKR